MMVSADVIIFIVSPSSVASRICDEEIAFARSLGKRLVPILCNPFDFEKLPPRLAALNIKISFAEEFDRPLKQLCDVLDTDIAWHRESTRIVSLSYRWQSNGKPKDQLLLGNELATAQTWAAIRPSNAPAIPDLVLEFLSSSAEKDKEDRLLQQIQAERYVAQYRLTEPMVRAEIAIREAGRTPLTKYDNGEADIQTAFLMELRSLLGSEKLWHQQPAQHLQTTDAFDGYLEVFRFPCCGATFADPRSNGPTDLPSQFRQGGCQDIPESIRYKSSDETFSWYKSMLVEFHEKNIGSISFQTPEKNKIPIVDTMLSQSTQPNKQNKQTFPGIWFLIGLMISLIIFLFLYIWSGSDFL